MKEKLEVAELTVKIDCKLTTPCLERVKTLESGYQKKLTVYYECDIDRIKRWRALMLEAQAKQKN